VDGAEARARGAAVRTLPARLVMLRAHVDDDRIEAELEEVVARLGAELRRQDPHALARVECPPVGELGLRHFESARYAHSKHTCS
jgi:hypothetical protein